jgi:hypothetical protein
VISVGCLLQTYSGTEGEKDARLCLARGGKGGLLRFKMKWNQMSFGSGFGWNKPFNMDAATLDRLNDKISKSNDSAIEGDLLARFRGLKVVYLDTLFKIEDEEEIKAIDKMLDEIKNTIKEQPVSRNRIEAGQFMSHKLSILESKIDEFERELMKLLYKYDIIHLKKQKKIPLEDEIKGDFE